jgi:hypothetical protein
MSNLDERFKSVPGIISQSCTQTSTVNADKDVVGSSIDVPAKPLAGTAYRIKMAGTKTGANAAFTLDLHLAGTNLITLTSDDASAVDWSAEFMVIFVDAKNQRVMGTLDSNTTDCEVDYAAGTVDCTAGGELKAVLASGNAGDTVTVEMVTVEAWQLELTTE